MTRYRPKHVEIEAFRWTDDDFLSLPAWFRDEVLGDRVTYRSRKDKSKLLTDQAYILNTANGPVPAMLGDWIIREPSGIGCYPCKDEVFRAKYEAVE